MEKCFSNSLEFNKGLPFIVLGKATFSLSTSTLLGFLNFNNWIILIKFFFNDG